MEPISAEKKLELIRNIREEHAKNLGSMKQRERILFGTESSYAIPTPQNTLNSSPTNAAPEMPSYTGLKIRFFFAVLFFVAFVIMDMGKITVKGIDADFVQRSMNKTFSTNVFDFMANIPYTLTEVEVNDE